jgi:hypothetical protein
VTLTALLVCLLRAACKNLVSLDDTFARTVSARLRAETAEQAEERVRAAPWGRGADRGGSPAGVAALFGKR